MVIYKATVHNSWLFTRHTVQFTTIYMAYSVHVYLYGLNHTLLFTRHTVGNSWMFNTTQNIQCVSIYIICSAHFHAYLHDRQCTIHVYVHGIQYTIHVYVHGIQYTIHGLFKQYKILVTCFAVHSSLWQAVYNSWLFNNMQY